MIASCIIIIVFILFLVAFIIQNNREKFITLSALNFAASSRARQMRYFDRIYGPQRRRAMFGSSYRMSPGLYPQFQQVGLYGFNNRFQGSRDMVTGKRIY